MPTRPEIIVAEMDDAKLVQQGARRLPPDQGGSPDNANPTIIPYGYIVQDDGYSVFVPNIDSVIARGFFAQIADIDRTPDDDYNAE